MTVNICDYIEEKKKKIDEALDKYLPGEDVFPKSIHKAIRYAVFPGGKRIRAILAITSAQACGGNMGDIMPSACAIEIIHAYSLIHDDLPAMDNDDYRRGKLSCHKKFGEAIGILTGDALLTLGFQLLCKGTRDYHTTVLRIREVSRAIGSTGMIGGQIVDMEEKGKKDSELAVLEYINTHKTGALIAASVKIGAIGWIREERLNAIFRFGQYIGLAFQIIDDVIDNDGYAQYLGVKEAMDEATRLTESAKYEIRNFGKKADNLRGIADFILNRKA